MERRKNLTLICSLLRKGQGHVSISRRRSLLSFFVAFVMRVERPSKDSGGGGGGGGNDGRRQAKHGACSHYHSSSSSISFCFLLQQQQQQQLVFSCALDLCMQVCRERGEKKEEVYKIIQRVGRAEASSSSWRLLSLSFSLHVHV